MRGSRRLVLSVVALTCSTLFPGTLVMAAPAQAGPVPSVATTTGPLDGLALTPPMGFNNWNAFGCDVNEQLIRETADALVSSGLADLGYEYVNIDDCWSLRERGPDGRLVPDPVKFPNGISGVADYVHSLGLKLGIYGDAGTRTCAGYPGSLGVEGLDAQTWAEWGVDYLKYDNCNNQSDGSREDFVRRYTAMREALDAAGRPIVYSIVEWGQSQPWEWAAGVGHLWRTTGDISDNWTSLRSIIAQNAPLFPYAGPDHWNDPDMMEIGNGGMTGTEYRTHMSMWAMMAAPLLIGTDLRTASPETVEILGNPEIIAIDQDPLGVPGEVVLDDGAGVMVLDRPLAGGDRAIALYNATDSLATVAIPAGETGLRRAPAYRLRDVWTGEVSQVDSTIAAAVPAHGTVVYRVRPLFHPRTVAPEVTVGAALGTLVPGTAGGETLTTTVTNRGAGKIEDLSVTVQAPDGWTVTASSDQNRRSLRTDRSLETTWAVEVPEGTSAGSYPITITAAYTWGRHRAATSSSELISTVVTAPADGRRHLSTIVPVSSTNARGPIELDQSNGGQDPLDGALITIGGTVYTRGLGTTAPSEIVYYLGGRCSQLVTEVGIDDEASTTLPATFTVYADDTEVAASGPVGSGAAPRTLTADLTGAAWLRLVTTGSGAASDGTIINDHTDWAAPVLTCGEVAPTDPVLPVEQTLFSFETGIEDWTFVNPDGGSVAQSTGFHTDGDHGLQVTTPAPGNWFGRPFSEPLDLSGASMLKFDVLAGPEAGTSGEIAVQMGPDLTWCQGGKWAWTNPGSTRTIVEGFDELECSGGVAMDPSQIRAIYVFLNGGEVYIDNVRAE